MSRHFPAQSKYQARWTLVTTNLYSYLDGKGAGIPLPRDMMEEMGASHNTVKSVLAAMVRERIVTRSARRARAEFHLYGLAPKSR